MHIRIKSETRDEYQYKNYKKGMKLKVQQEYDDSYIATVVQPEDIRNKAGIKIKNWMHDTTIAVHKDDCFVLRNSKLAPNGNILNV
jgi:hypothetical protein